MAVVTWHLPSKKLVRSKQTALRISLIECTATLCCPHRGQIGKYSLWATVFLYFDNLRKSYWQASLGEMLLGYTIAIITAHEQGLYMSLWPIQGPWLLAQIQLAQNNEGQMFMFRVTTLSVHCAQTGFQLWTWTCFLFWLQFCLPFYVLWTHFLFWLQFCLPHYVLCVIIAPKQWKSDVDELTVPMKIKNKNLQSVHLTPLMGSVWHKMVEVLQRVLNPFLLTHCKLLLPLRHRFILIYQRTVNHHI